MSVTTTTPPVAPPRDSRPGDRTEWALAGALLLVAAAAGLVIASSPTLGVLAGAGLLLIAATAVWPTHAVIGYVAVTPLIVGLDRGAVVPGLRLNEVLLAPLVAGVALAGLYRWYRTGWPKPRGVHRLDAVVLLLAVTGSVTTLLWMYARGREITGEDVQYALALWKLAVLYAVVRMFVRGPRAVRATLLVTVASAAFVGAIGMLQTVGVGPVLDLLGRFISPGEEGFDAAGGRATSTIGNPHAFGDVLVYAAVVAGALAVTGRRNRWPIAAVAAALAAGSLASGSFSTAMALATAGIAFAVVTGTARWLVAGGIALAPLAYLGLQPVVKSRFSDLDPNTGLPASWTDRYGRLDNLRTYFWPRLGEDFNWLLGVRPTSRVPGVVEPWVYIESGYTWALWNGGLPLLLAILALLVAMLGVGRRLRFAATPEGRALGIALSVMPWTLGVLMFLDPHLTIRGGAEILFVLLALGATADGGRPRAAPAARRLPPAPSVPFSSSSPGSGRGGRLSREETPWHCPPASRPTRRTSAHPDGGVVD